MMVNKAYKFRIYPNKEQEILIAKTIGCSRFVFNHFLANWDNTYKETGKGLTYNSCSAQLTQLGRMFGISKTHVGDIILGKRWSI